MHPSDLNEKIVNRGEAIFAAIADEKPSLFDAATWTGKVIDWCLRNDEFRTSLFRFVDVFPVLSRPEQMVDHLHQYFGATGSLPPVLATGARMVEKLGTLGGALLAKTVAHNIHDMARQFILGENEEDLVRKLQLLHREGYGAVVDLLGEATLSHEEADRYLDRYLALLGLLAHEQQSWHVSPGFEQAPKINLAVKPTALFCLANPMDFEGSVAGILAPLRRLAAAVVSSGAFLCIDMESYRFKAITLEVYRRLKEEFRDYPHIGLALQAYLHDSEADLAQLLDWATEAGIPISIRLVKGAYWDYETVRSTQMGWRIPVYSSKPETDAAFERLATTILQHHGICHFACASHNIRSIAAVLETARALAVPDGRYEFQMLYGMAEPVRRAIRSEAGRVRLYAPYGEMVPGMGYLVRRLLENTSNESFLRLNFSGSIDVASALADPGQLLARQGGQLRASPLAGASAAAAGFRNEPAADFTRADVRAAFPEAIAAVRRQFGQTVPLKIDGEDLFTGVTAAGVNPNRPAEQLGLVCQAGAHEVGLAIAAAGSAYPAWRDSPVAERAACLQRVASLARERLFELAAWQVLEVGKQWDQAHADVTEAIDFLEYYAAGMLDLGKPQTLGTLPGEENRQAFTGRGVAAVIAPWNFPLAIACGMVSAALVTGNTVVFKSSGLAALTGRRLVELFHDAGIPAGVLNFVPGSGAQIGDLLTAHPAVALIAFTGSLEVGLRIAERAAVVQPHQRCLKRVVTELGGKNAIIIDEDADLDDAVPQVLASAFGFQGQKCSACSRVIVLSPIYERFVARLVAAAGAWRVGPAEDPAFALGALVDRAAQTRVLEYIRIGRTEGELLYSSPVPAEEGFWVPLTIFGNITPEHRLAQEEIFGPVLALMRAESFDQALSWANASRFALTGGVFSRSPANIERARQEFRVGNLYVNRAITGAMVGRQPFGGFALSGGGTKAGGADYLRHFMDTRVITENTMRRGFTPAPA